MYEEPGCDGGAAAENAAAGSAGSGVPRPLTTAATFVGPVDVLPMCNKDFMVSPGAAKVCGVVGDFVHLPLLSEFFKKMGLKDMVRSVEANAMKVCGCPATTSFVLFARC